MSNKTLTSRGTESCDTLGRVFSVGEAGAGISSLPQVFARRIETAAFAGVQLSVYEALPELPASQLGIVRAPGGEK